MSPANQGPPRRKIPASRQFPMEPGEMTTIGKQEGISKDGWGHAMAELL